MTIYIHIPFCIKKCNYCDFFSITDRNETLVKKYISSVSKELLLYASNKNKYFHTNNPIISSIFFGGGTPTSIDTKYIKNIIQTIKSNFTLDNNCEITIEVNPATNIDFNELNKSFINRISIGIQSFIDEELILLGRIHSAKLAGEILEKAKLYFNNINVDIMFSIPNQTIKTLSYTLDNVLKSNVQHISTYSLIYEPGTQLYNSLKNKKNNKKTDLEDSKLYKYIYTILKDNGFYHYEVSNFAKENYKCKHNLNYWNHNEYLGIGAAAYGFINSKRYYNYYDINKYCNLIENNQFPIENIEILSKEEIYTEKLFLGLRSEGVNLKFLKKEHINYCKQLEQKGFALFYQKNNNIFFKLTSYGYFLCDEITLKLLS